MADRIDVYDTTLRDGAQAEGINLSCADKIRIAQRLDELGIAYIEGGWPGSNPKDAEFFARAAEVDWQQATVCAFGATRRRDAVVEEDENLRALLAVRAKVCTLVGKSSMLHVREVLRTSPDQNLRMIEESIAWLRAHGRRVFYDAEHFFDGFAEDADYALETLCAAARAGAEVLVLCDTNGGSLPWRIEEVVRQVAGTALGMPLGIHCHNDAELAVANTLAAVRAGAGQVQGTINGYGERCGNANLCSVIPDLELKLGRPCLPPGRLAGLYELSRLVAEVANAAPNEHLAYVGRSAFAHKGGIHVAAMRRDERAYQHIDPARVGNTMRVVVSELSGRGNLAAKAEELGVAGDGAAEVLEEIKQLEARGFAFEAADASVALMLERQAQGYRAPFRLVDYTVVVEHRDGRGTFAEATVKVEVDGVRYHTAAEGDGPVHALDAALRKALAQTYPQVADFRLVDYKVRILDGEQATAATTRVLIDTASGERRWTTVGASTNIIEASWRALADSFEFGLRPPAAVAATRQAS
ncbi:MAG TPA: citramalate synthase [Kofleriaceae bacterium]|nr:citramalate synthase [Kofleriaceae bacterium]